MKRDYSTERYHVLVCKFTNIPLLFAMFFCPYKEPNTISPIQAIHCMLPIDLHLIHGKASDPYIFAFESLLLHLCNLFLKPLGPVSVSITLDLVSTDISLQVFCNDINLKFVMLPPFLVVFVSFFHQLPIS